MCQRRFDIKWPVQKPVSYFRNSINKEKYLWYTQCHKPSPKSTGGKKTSANGRFTIGFLMILWTNFHWWLNVSPMDIDCFYHHHHQAEKTASGNQNGRKPTLNNWIVSSPCLPKDTKRYIVANSRNLRISVFKAGQNSLSTAGCFPPLRSLIRIWMGFFTTDFPDPAVSSEVFFQGDFEYTF